MACFKNIGCFFEALHPESQITEVTVKVSGQLIRDIDSLRSRKETEEANYRRAKNADTSGKKLPKSLYSSSRRGNIAAFVNTDKATVNRVFQRGTGNEDETRKVDRI